MGDGLNVGLTIKTTIYFLFSFLDGVCVCVIIGSVRCVAAGPRLWAERTSKNIVVVMARGIWRRDCVGGSDERIRLRNCRDSFAGNPANTCNNYTAGGDSLRRRRRRPHDIYIII